MISLLTLLLLCTIAMVVFYLIAYLEIYFYKTGTEMDVGEVEGGIDATAFVFDTDHLDCKFHRRDNNLNYWEYPIGTTLTKDDSFFMITKMTTPSNLSGSPNAIAYIGYRDNATLYSTYNHVMCIWSSSAPGVMQAQIRTSDSTYYVGATTYTVSPSTTYYVALSYSSVTKSLSVLIYDSTKSLLATLVTSPVAVTKNFTLDSAGYSGYAAGGSTTSSFAEDWIFTEIKANSGTTEEFPASGGSAKGPFDGFQEAFGGFS